MPVVHRIDEASFRRDLFTESLMRTIEGDVRRTLPASKSPMELEQEISFFQAKETAAISQLTNEELRVIQGFNNIRPSRYLFQRGVSEELKARQSGVQA